MQSVIDGLQQSALSGWLVDSAWAWPALEILHFFGLSLLLGALLVFDLRLVGFFPALPVAALRPLPRLMAAGFAINLASGVLFFVGDPGRYAVNIGFQLKMCLVLLAGINALVFMRRYGQRLAGWQTHDDAPRAARILAGISLFAWLGVLLLGRLIPYVGTG